MPDRTEIESRLDAATKDHRLLEHPFYKAWAAGTLTRDDLAFYATQYWRQVEAFPQVLEDLSARLEGTPREALEENLKDERDGDHPKLWLDFAAALGVSPDQVAATAPEPETKECVGSFATAALAADEAFALGMLYGYESQTPEVAQTKVDGLRSHYGIDGEGVTYFELHGELDVDHARQLAGAIGEVSGGDPAPAEAGAAAGAKAVWTLLDGVCRARGIC
jgi:pyrroloquinoline-quinone synthase